MIAGTWAAHLPHLDALQSWVVLRNARGQQRRIKLDLFPPCDEQHMLLCCGMAVGMVKQERCAATALDNANVTSMIEGSLQKTCRQQKALMYESSIRLLHACEAVRSVGSAADLPGKAVAFAARPAARCLAALIRTG